MDGKVLRIRKTLAFEDLHGNLLCQIKERLLTIKDTICGQKGADLPVARPLGWKVKNGPDRDVQGDILNHEYMVKDGCKKVAEVSKKWLKLADTYSVGIDPGQNDILILAVAVAIDMLVHDDDDKKKKKEK